MLSEGAPANPNQRVNPFDRSPNLPPNILNQNENVTFVSRLHRYIIMEFISNLYTYLSYHHRMFRWPRLFTSNSTDDIESQIDEIVPVDSVAVATSTTIPTNTSSSNNLLNTNLSGSFRDSDDEQLMERNIYEPTATAAAATESNHQLQQSPSAPAASSSTSMPRLGVAAIPNTQFCPTTPLSSRSNRHKNGDDYVV